MSATLKRLMARHRNLLRLERPRIQAELIGLNPEKVILFGSAARGEETLTSDLDYLVVIKEEAGPESFIERNARVYKAVKPRIAVDILVYTPEEFAEMKGRSPFVKRALQEGIVVYEKKG